MDLYDRTLVKWPVLYETLYVPTRHGDTFVIISGKTEAPPLILLHGSCSNALSFMGDVPEYSRSFRLYAVDIPGEAGKSSPNRPDWNCPAFAEWMEDLFSGLGIHKATLLGISLGGWTALKFAVHRPESVEKLVLLSPGGIVSAKLSFILGAVVFSMFGRRGAEKINRIVFGKQPVDERAVRFVNTIMTHFKARIGVQNLYTDEELSRLTMPALLVVGAQDAVIPVGKTAARMKRLVSCLKVEMLADMGHVLYNIAPVIMRFLTEERQK